MHGNGKLLKAFWSYTACNVYHKVAFTVEVSLSTSTYDARWMCFNFTHILMNIVGSIELHDSLRTFSIRIVWLWKTVKSILVLYTMQGKKIYRICKKNIKMKNNAVQNKNTIPRAYCLPRSLEHIFPGIIKTFHSDKRSDNK